MGKDRRTKTCTHTHRERKRERERERRKKSNNFLKRFYLFIFREKGREGEREGQKHQCVVVSHAPQACALTGDLAHSPGKYPDWELNQ